MATDTLDYREPGPLTRLEPAQIGLAEGSPDDPVGICGVVQGLVIQPADASASGVAKDRLAEKDLRPVSRLIAALTAVDPAPLHQPREPRERIVGTCRHFATLACALLRLRGIAARARCGFGMCFLPGRGADHWITEYWQIDEERWVRVDVEHLGHGYVTRPEDLAADEFLTGGEAWVRYREGLVDPHRFGVPGTDHAWGPAEISGNAVRDLAALCKREMLPWDEWGRMTDAYEGRTGSDYDRLIDEVAAACAADDPAVLIRLYGHQELRAPDDLVR
jgi:hypothetical protein